MPDPGEPSSGWAAHYPTAPSSAAGRVPGCPDDGDAVHLIVQTSAVRQWATQCQADVVGLPQDAAPRQIRPVLEEIDCKACFRSAEDLVVGVNMLIKAQRRRRKGDAAAVTAFLQWLRTQNVVLADYGGDTRLRAIPSVRALRPDC